MVGGGDHGAGGGGYSGGASQDFTLGQSNGLSADSQPGYDCCIPGGYYAYPKTYQTFGWFGLGGTCWYSQSGSGGIAGSGGDVKYSKRENIYAYNGDRITNGDYSTTYYQYDKAGNLTSTVANVVTKPDGSKIIPAQIFLQNGISREVYGYLCFLSPSLLERYGLTRDATSYELTKIASENTSVTNFGQGIGSGAGYIELSNGTFAVDPSLN